MHWSVGVGGEGKGGGGIQRRIQRRMERLVHVCMKSKSKNLEQKEVILIVRVTLSKHCQMNLLCRQVVLQS